MKAINDSVGKLKKIPIRDVWPHEALDFTSWLQDNIEILNETIGINLSSAEREQSAGDFKVDILAEDESGDPVVIENQIGKSDHDHLGKIITYLTSFEAKTAIWLVSDPRPEHITAITWLNETAPEAFYLLRLEAVKIGDSRPAPLFTPIVGPSEESRQIGQKKKEWAEREKLRHKFWNGLLERASTRTNLHKGISPGHDSYINTGAGMAGLSYAYVIRKHDSQVEMYIDRGKGNKEENDKIFNFFKSHQKPIEDEFGDRIDWEYLEGRRACRIAKYIDQGGYRDSEKEWPNTQNIMIEAMIRLEKALSPHLEKLDI